MNAYPLNWPEGWPRTAPADRADARFSSKRDRNSFGRNLTVAEGVRRVMDEIKLFTRAGKPWRINPDSVVISTNLLTRRDGLPRSDQRAPADPGVAIYWVESRDKKRVMAIDRYMSVADNLAAVAATLDAMRAIERHGGARILERAFTGFDALPAPGKTSKRSWRQVFGFTDTQAVRADLLRGTYRLLAAKLHPDRGGSTALMSELNVAYEEAKKEVQ